MENKQADIYGFFGGLLMVFGGIIGGAVAWLAVFSEVPAALSYCLMLGWLAGLPMAWLTVRSVRKRNLRRDWRGCLKTAAFGAWWSAITVGSLLCLPAYLAMLLNIKTSIAVVLLFCFGLPAVCGAVTALLLSVFLPKPET